MLCRIKLGRHVALRAYFTDDKNVHMPGAISVRVYGGVFYKSNLNAIDSAQMASFSHKIYIYKFMVTHWTHEKICEFVERHVCEEKKSPFTRLINVFHILSF